MHAKQLVKKSIIVGFIFLAMLGLIFPSISADLIKDGTDGVWSDDFANASYVELTNCSVDNGAIALNQDIINRTYDFKDSANKAYSYVSFLFFPRVPYYSPDRHTSSEDEFDAHWEVRPIKNPNDDEYAIRSSKILRPFVVHHFRFKLDVEEDYDGDLEIHWRGKADNDLTIRFYYWEDYKITKGGRWLELASNQSNGNIIEFSDTITGDNLTQAINDDNIFDFCVVVANSFLQTCKIYTDYVNVSTVGETGYVLDPGSAITKDPIEPRTISNIPTKEDYYWDILTWDDYESEGATVEYHVLYRDSSGNYTLVEDKYFSEGKNSEGFTDPPIHLNLLPTQETNAYDKLKIMANLTTNTPSRSPKIYSWTITWQTNTNRWQDLFNHPFRIETKDKVNISGGAVTISPVQGEWPLFGFNAQNTRAANVKGAKSANSYWFSNAGVGGSFLNPVIGDEIIYIASSTNGKVYGYKVTLDGDPEGGIHSPIYSSNHIAYDLVSSPAVAEDYVIVATGKTAPGGNDNFVYAFKKTLGAPAKEFLYPENICYYSSPVVVDDKVFVTSWGGDTNPIFTYENNKVIALNLANDLDKLWEYELPARSYSTPAVYNNMLFVGCNEKKNASLFALDIENNGNKIWSKSVGAIGKASPVIYEDTVYIMSKAQGQLKLTALSIENGDILWTKTIITITTAPADLTPAVYNDILYVPSPDGAVYAYNVKDGNEPDDSLWETQVYNRGITGNFLSSSPAFADGLMYIGTPSGKLYALNAETNGSIAWTYTAGPSHTPHPILSSPIVSNGLVFIGDEYEYLHSVGSFEAPDVNIEGSIISIPIKLPTGSWWKNFYVSYNATAAGNDIKFSLLDKDKNFLKTIKNESRIILENTTIGRTIRLQAELSADNISVNPELYSWYVTFEPDHKKPIFALETLYPAPDGWLNEMKVPMFTVEVKDNETGLNVDSAKCTLKYKVEDGTDTKTFNINCTGEDGTTATQLITANIASLDVYDNITQLINIEISISDLAGNENSTGVITFKQDTVKPESKINNETNGKEFNTTYVVINATANDPGDPNVNASGIALVELKYRHSLNLVFSGDWQTFGTSNKTSPSWNFTAVKGGGYYELITIATDVVGNVEDEPDEEDVTFTLDPNAPSKPVLEGTYWFNSLPEFSITFSDDFRLKKIEYRPSFDSEWTVIDSNVNAKTYDGEWELKQDYWDEMTEGEEYLLYFKLTDTLRNVYTSSVNDALKLRKDVTNPHVSLEIPGLETEWSWQGTFDISAFATDGEGSGIKTVELYYRFSDDNETWSDWKIFGNTLTSDPFDWEFTAEKNGYYKFKIVAEDLAGNVAESSIFSTGLNVFPSYLVAAMAILLVALILIIIILFIKWKKKIE